MLREILSAAPRILSLSSSVRPDSTSETREGQFFDAFLSFRTLLDSLPGLLIVQAVGNDGYEGAYTARDSLQRDVFQEALVMLRNASNDYSARIVFVGETDINGNRATESNAFTGLVDVYAPGFGVPVVLPDGSADVASGTSFAAPTVAGIAGQLLAADPTLSAADLKSLLLAGARDSVENSSGVNVAPSRVGNTTDVVYEADSYGSLRVLSARNGTPLCGAQLVPSLQSSAGYIDTRAIRDSSSLPELIPDFSLSQQSLAPGGRLFAGMSSHLIRFVSGGWQPYQTAPDSARRLFGERDTLTYFISGNPYATPTLQLRVLPSGAIWNLSPESAFPQ